MPPAKRLLVFILCFTICYTSILFFVSPKLPAPPSPAAGVAEDMQPEALPTPEPADSTSLPQIEGGVAAGDGGSPPAEQLETGDEEMETASEMLTMHFARSEFACDCTDYCTGFPTEMDPFFMNKLQQLRDAAGGPIIITSGVRCKQRNAEVGGVPYSYHLRGLAADLYCPGLPLGELTALARAVGLNVITYYHHGYIHVELV